MQSFSASAKAEICREYPQDGCCALAECFGILLFCNCFQDSLIKIITESQDFAKLLPKLFRKAFGVSFDRLPPEGAEGKRTLSITDADKLSAIFDAFGADRGATLSHHINFGVIEEDCCRASFIRGAFLAGGSVTDPEKRYHLELATSHRSVSREAYSILLDMGFSPKETERAGNSLLYFKQADAIADFFTTIGASGTAMDIMTAKVEKEMRNTVTRQINCDSHNADKTVAAAQEQPYDTVILVSPSHFPENCGSDVVTATAGWNTPYGPLAADRSVADALLQDAVIAAEDNRDAVESDHGAAGLVPFVRRYLPEAKLVVCLLSNRLSRERLAQVQRVLLEQQECP